MENAVRYPCAPIAVLEKNENWRGTGTVLY